MIILPETAADVTTNYNFLCWHKRSEELDAIKLIDRALAERKWHTVAIINDCVNKVFLDTMSLKNRERFLKTPDLHFYYQGILPAEEYAECVKSKIRWIDKELGR